MSYREEELKILRMNLRDREDKSIKGQHFLINISEEENKSGNRRRRTK